MRRSRTGLALAMMLACSSPPVMAEPATDVTLVSSDDGSVTLELPQGALPDGATVTITLRPPAEVPVELASLGGKPTQYRIEPADLVFGTPARLTRRIPLAAIGRTASTPLPLGILASRSPDGTWAWLEGASFGLDAADGSIELSATIDRAGSVFAFVAGEVTSGVATPQAGGIGQVLVPETTFTAPQDLETAVTAAAGGPAITDPTGGTLDPVVATAGEPLVSSLFGDLVVSQPFECMAAGMTDIETAFTVEGLAVDAGLAAATGLPPARSGVRVTGTIECVE